MTLTSDVFDFIVTSGITTKMTEGYMPDSPNDIITIYQTPGLPGDEIFNDPGIRYEHPGLQIKNRSADYNTGMTKAEELYRLLQLTNVILGGRLYQRIMPTHNPFLLERDAKQRSVFITNYLCMAEAPHG